MSQGSSSKLTRPDDDEGKIYFEITKLIYGFKGNFIIIGTSKSNIPRWAATKFIDLKLIEGNQQIMVRVCARRQKGTRLEYGVMDNCGEGTMKVFQKFWKQFRELEINGVYKFHNFTVRPGYQGGDPEIILMGKSTVDRIDDDGFQKIPFSSTDLKDISAVPDGTSICMLFMDHAIFVCLNLNRMFYL
ncbi:unnamed protein product [Orchesella dallaii]|uniref:Uncharacterized protein n=1 Tax=Orchesella dallaii TaxID=48710 RepID=A0ABP1PTF8_9HEXA